MDTSEKNILEFPQQLSRKGLVRSRLELLKNIRPDLVVVFGMGGSGVPGEILRSVQDEIGLHVPVISWKDDGLPDLGQYHAKRPLFVFISFSGDTEEPIDAFETMLKLRTRPACAVITTGGHLLLRVEKEKVPLVTFEKGTLQPREGVGRMFYGLLEVLYAAHLISHMDFDHTDISPRKYRAPGELWAKRLAKKLIVLYTDNSNYANGYIWKTRFNENAKREAFLNLLPEMNHHEIIPLGKPHFKTAAIFITEPEPYHQFAKRLRINFSILEERGILVWHPAVNGKTRLERIWQHVMLANWVTYFMAKTEHQDPHNIKILEDLKARLRK